MVLRSGRECRVICVSILAGLLLVLCVYIEPLSEWNPLAGFFTGNSIYAFINSLKNGDCTAIYDEAQRSAPRNRAIFPSQFFMGVSSDYKSFADLGENVRYAGITGGVFEKPRPHGADMVSRE